MKARHCDECNHFAPKSLRGHSVPCAKGHKPRFHLPTRPLDDDWGWKRNCEDFEPKEIK